MQFTPQQTGVIIQILQEIQNGQNDPPAEPEVPTSDVLGEIREANEITAAMQTRFWDYVRQPGLTSDATIDIQVAWTLTAWQAQLNGSIKVMAVKGDVDSLRRLAGMQLMSLLTPMEIFTSVMWAFWFNQSEAARFLMSLRFEPSQLTRALYDLYYSVLHWYSIPAGSTKDNLRNTIMDQKMSSFTSGDFFNEFPQASRFLNDPIEDSREAILVAMENQRTFHLPLVDIPKVFNAFGSPLLMYM
ncbi:hypothetical protein BJ085DRAFT_37603 [Dimargaris cristalligena]|uniref:Uncharacterized protein n=1 Tax=Dimargaris cristalligena TaxID=215637 RepID=A0A4P9ZJJ4_9FUNG|nr:hypothetical protein BJ085DRAFT_37603 [Dimargaris cristalligena]|eukprot:RKP33384.1 hypothetical protein BJ085DRAFT_37603 [Dimargaris cristalligena]